MKAESRNKLYKSQAKFNPKRIHAAAVYCSDGRFSEQFDDLLRNSLRLPDYDRVAIPGGPACLAGYPGVSHEEAVAVDQLELLITAHQLSRVVLIAHQECAYYTEQLGISPDDQEQHQREDLAKAVERIGWINPTVTVDCYLAHIEQKHIVFEQLPG